VTLSVNVNDLFVKMQNPDHRLYQLLPTEQSTTDSMTDDRMCA